MVSALVLESFLCYAYGVEHSLDRISQDFTEQIDPRKTVKATGTETHSSFRSPHNIENRKVRKMKYRKQL